MGTLTYGSPEHVYTIGDRALMHLQIVIIDKLRRGEQFGFSHEDEAGRRTLWMTPDIPLQFHFHEPMDADVNSEWVAALERTTRSAQGLHLVDEPDGVDPRSATQTDIGTRADLASPRMQDALDSRVLIEQAKGILAEADHIGMDEALRRLEDRARSTQRTTSAVAREVIDGAGQG